MLDLDRAGIRYDKRGITVDRRLRTTAAAFTRSATSIDGSRISRMSPAITRGL